MGKKQSMGVIGFDRREGCSAEKQEGNREGEKEREKEREIE